MLAAVIGASLALLFPVIYLGIIFGFLMASGIIVLTSTVIAVPFNYSLFGYVLCTFIGIGLCVGQTNSQKDGPISDTNTHKGSFHLLCFSSLGALLLTMGIDQLLQLSFSRVIFSHTRPSQTPVTCDSSCGWLLIMWLLLSATGVLVQQRLLASHTHKRVNFPRCVAPTPSTSSSSTSIAAGMSSGCLATPHAQTETANFNYFADDSLTPALSATSRLLLPDFQMLARHYGFQDDNSRNQLEHLLFLLVNTQSAVIDTHSAATPDACDNSSRPSGTPKPEGLNGATPSPRAVQAASILHRKILGNYLSWCAYIKVACSSPRSSALSTIAINLIESA
jgi:hypothetical protein